MMEEDHEIVALREADRVLTEKFSLALAIEAYHASLIKQGDAYQTTVHGFQLNYESGKCTAMIYAPEPVTVNARLLVIKRPSR